MDSDSEVSRWKYVDLDEVPFAEPESWYKGEHFNKFPWDRRITPGDVLLGFEPPEKFIHRDTKVLAFGSCFAEHFVNGLAKEGYNDWVLPLERHELGGSGPIIPFWATFENIFVILQQFRWAFEGFVPKPGLWFKKDKKAFEATEDRLAKVKYALANAEVFVISLGLSEVWFDAVENEPMWRTVPVSAYEPGRHVNRRVSVEETVEALHALERIVEKHLPGRRIVFTVSPVAMTATFYEQSAISATFISKAILRVALDLFTRDEAIRKKCRYFYFPAYELLYNLYDKPLLPDNIHVRPEVADSILEIFKALYTNQPTQDLGLLVPKSYVRDLEDRYHVMDRELVAKERVIRELNLANLEAVCQERLQVIQDQEARIRMLEGIAQERLLEMEAKDRRCQMLEAVAKERLASIEEKEDLIHELSARPQ
jgi:hypothetical protein